MGEIPEADTYFILLESGGTIHPPFSFIENMQIITKTLRAVGRRHGLRINFGRGAFVRTADVPQVP